MKEGLSALSAVFRTTRSVLKTAFRLRLRELVQWYTTAAATTDFLHTTSTSGLLPSGSLIQLCIAKKTCFLGSWYNYFWPFSPVLLRFMVLWQGICLFVCLFFAGVRWGVFGCWVFLHVSSHTLNIIYNLRFVFGPCHLHISFYVLHVIQSCSHQGARSVFKTHKLMLWCISVTQKSI